MSEFRTPLATETIKEIIFSVLPIANIQLDDEDINRIKTLYNEEKLFKIHIEIIKAGMDKKNSEYVSQRIQEIVSEG